MHPDAVVIGAGIVGAACGEALARRGIRTLLLEGGEEAGGCTGAGGGMLTLLSKQPGPHLRLARRSLQLLAADERRWGKEIGLRWSGSMALAGQAGELAEATARARLLRAAGVPAEMLDAALAREAEPEIGAAVLGALRVPVDGQVDPSRYCRAALDAARAAGASVRTGEVVKALTAGEGRIRGVDTGSGTVEAGIVVLAAGVWSGSLLAPHLPELAAVIRPRRGVLLRAEAPVSRFRHVLLEADYYAKRMDQDRDLVAFSLQQTWDGRLWVGGSRSFGPAPSRPASEGEHEAIRERACDYVPGLAAVRFTESTVGLRPWTPDGLPLVGSSGLEGLWLATGHEGDGVAMAAVTAQVLADLIEGRAPDPDAAALDPRRFAGGSDAARPASIERERPGEVNGDVRTTVRPRNFPAARHPSGSLPPGGGAAVAAKRDPDPDR